MRGFHSAALSGPCWSLLLLCSGLLMTTVRASPQASYTTSLTPALTTSSASTATPTGGLPIVNLDYQLHQALSYNATGNFYNFSNVRFAAPPVGNLRFAAPQAPSAANASVVDNGSQGRMCPQAQPAWELTAAQFLPEYLAGKPINVTQPNNTLVALGEFVQTDPRTTEDCLFLDLLVPKPVLDRATNSSASKAPVILWIYGGGYTSGDKSNFAGASGLLHQSNDSVIFIAINYRLGAFGFLSGRNGSAFANQGGVSNAGLLDQRFALEWVQKYISRFGGDPNKVTIIGESAGGGSIEHQITAYGGARSVPFQQAILQSPGFVPVVSASEQNATYALFSQLAGAASLAELRSLPSQALIKANLLQIANSPYGTFSFGPAVDDTFAPDLPGRLLAEGKFAKDVSVMVGHNRNEGLLFTSPFATTDAAVRQTLTSILPTTSNDTLNYVLDVLYPANFSGVYGYKDDIQRTDLITTEFIFTCNTFYLDLAYNNQTYAYIFDIPPALHGMDVPYTFFSGSEVSSSVSNVTVARALQDWIVSFAATGTPSVPGGKVDGHSIPNFVMYGPNATVEVLEQANIVYQTDDAANARCRWWQEGFYAPLNNSPSTNGTSSNTGLPGSGTGSGSGSNGSSGSTGSTGSSTGGVTPSTGAASGLQAPSLIALTLGFAMIMINMLTL